MENLESRTEGMYNNHISRREEAVAFNRSYTAKFIALCGMIASALAPAGCSSDSGGSSGGSKDKKNPPNISSFVVSPNPGKRGNSRTFSVSGSNLGTISYDFDGDGSWDQTTTSTSVTYVFPNAGDHNPRVRASNSDGSDTATTSSDTGFGDDANSSVDALTYSSGELTTLGYNPTPNQQLNIINPATGDPVSFNALKGDNAGKLMYVVYNNDLNAEQKACLDEREAIGQNEPPVVRIYLTDSPDVIDSKLSAASLLAQSIAKAQAMQEKKIMPAQVPVVPEDDCPDEEYPAPEPVPAGKNDVF
jgi:hypothetical protein